MTEAPNYRGFVVPLKTLLVTATQRAFSSQHPQDDFKSLHVSIEYPVEQTHYPGIWVDFNITSRLQIAGIDHTEHNDVEVELPGGDVVTRAKEYRRWRFQGTALWTVVAMSSWQRDRLLDEAVLVVAGWEGQVSTPFRQTIEDNDFLGFQLDFDSLSITGMTAAPGTPWGTDEIIYEATMSATGIGEFVIDPGTGNLIPISDIELYPYTDPPGDPLGDDNDPPWR